MTAGQLFVQSAIDARGTLSIFSQVSVSRGGIGPVNPSLLSTAYQRVQKLGQVGRGSIAIEDPQNGVWRLERGNAGKQEREKSMPADVMDDVIDLLGAFV